MKKNKIYEKDIFNITIGTQIGHVGFHSELWNKIKAFLSKRLKSSKIVGCRRQIMPRLRLAWPVFFNDF
ncbi:MAG: hypothetical protein WDZ41_02620 [Candidatus Babeliales bacterium]